MRIVRRRSDKSSRLLKGLWCRMLLGTTSVVAYAAPLAAQASDPASMAQAADPTTVSAQSQSSQIPAGQAAIAEPDQPGTGEIVVTATRNATPVSRVPISVAALSTEQLDKQGLRNVEDVLRTVPGVSFSRGGQSTTQVSIRGISSNVGAATTGVYLNDTPIQARAIGQGGTFSNFYPTIFDLDRIEVLRGPQGTLFGAGSEGGTIRFITPQPNLDKLSVYTRGELAFTEKGAPSYEAGAAIGAPLIADRLGFRVSGYYRRDGGYIDRVDPLTGARIDKNANAEEALALRAAMTWKPVDAVTITPSIFYQRRKIDNQATYWGYLSNPENGDYRSGSRIEQPSLDRIRLYSLDAHADLGPVSLYSTTSYLDRDQTVDQDWSRFFPALLGVTVRPGIFIPGLPGYTSLGRDYNTQKQFVQEVRLQSNNPGSRLKWVLGVFYQNSRQTANEAGPETVGHFNQLTQAIFGADAVDVFGVPLVSADLSYFPKGTQFDFINRVDGKDIQLAAFADVTYRIFDGLSASVGLRAAKTKFTFVSFADGPFNSGRTDASGRQKETPVTPKFNLSWQADENNLLYGTVSKGFRVGGANSPVASRCGPELAELGLTQAPPSYNSDSVWSYEVGSKNAFFDRKLRVAASAYLIKWSNIQQSINLASCGLAFTANVGTATGKGFDLAIDLRVAAGLTLSTSVGYNNTYFTKTVLGGLRDDGTQGTIVNKGDKVEVYPWIVAASANYEFQMLGKDSYLQLDYRYRARTPNNTIVLDPRNTSYVIRPFRADASNIVNARAGVRLGSVDFSVFVNNLFNDYAKLSRVQFSPAMNEIDEYIVPRPRTIGVTASARY